MLKGHLLNTQKGHFSVEVRQVLGAPGLRTGMLLLRPPVVEGELHQAYGEGGNRSDLTCFPLRQLCRTHEGICISIASSIV